MIRNFINIIVITMKLIGILIAVAVMPVLLFVLFAWITTSDAYVWNYTDLRNDVYEYFAASDEKFDLRLDTEYDKFEKRWIYLCTNSDSLTFDSLLTSMFSFRTQSGELKDERIMGWILDRCPSSKYANVAALKDSFLTLKQDTTWYDAGRLNDVPSFVSRLNTTLCYMTDSLMWKGNDDSAYDREMYYFNWLRHKDDIQEYVRNSDSYHFWSNPSYCYMVHSLDYLEYKTDSVKVDSMLIILLKFRDKNGIIQGNGIHRATIEHIRNTQRKHLLPYIQQLRDSFDSYPSDMRFDTQRSCGNTVMNRNIKGEIEEDIKGIIRQIKE